jgi:hypothetical protein
MLRPFVVSSFAFNKKHVIVKVQWNIGFTSLVSGSIHFVVTCVFVVKAVSMAVSVHPRCTLCRNSAMIVSTATEGGAGKEEGYDEDEEEDGDDDDDEEEEEEEEDVAAATGTTDCKMLPPLPLPYSHSTRCRASVNRRKLMHVLSRHVRILGWSVHNFSLKMRRWQTPLSTPKPVYGGPGR